jgi:hypothetical protein
MGEVVEGGGRRLYYWGAGVALERSWYGGMDFYVY